MKNELALEDQMVDTERTTGVRMITITTPVGNFKVWTRKFGNNPRIKILLLHGGPGSTHEYMECMEPFFEQAGFEFHQYDQLGSFYSDQPQDTSLWTIPRFVDEVEQVRQSISADETNFYLFGSSWGGILGMEYALKYQQHLKALIVSNMVASAPDYGRYAEVLAKQMDPGVLAEIRDLEAKKDYDNPRYMELLVSSYYAEHIFRLKEYPESLIRTMNHMNNEIYNLMQGPGELGISGTLADWDIKDRLNEIVKPSLMIGARYDTMDPKAMEEQSKLVQNGRYLCCPNGSHTCIIDDQQVFMDGVVKFIKDVDSGDF